MTLPLIFRPEADNDLVQAFRWYQERRDGLGVDFMLCVEESLDRIRRSPESYPIVYGNVRQGLVHRFPYVIYFVADAADLTIIAVHHGSRNPATWKRRV